MSRVEFDDECPGCKPVLLDLKTRTGLPDDAPEMQALNTVWAGTSYEERQAFHRVTCLNSRDASDLRLVQAVTARFQQALSN